MSKNILNAGYVRINQAMLNLMVLLRTGDKDSIVKVANNLMEDCDEWIESLYSVAGVSEEDIVRISSSQDVNTLIKQAKWTPGSSEEIEEVLPPISQEESPLDSNPI